MTTPRGGGDVPSSTASAAAAASTTEPNTPTSAHTSGLNRRGSRSAAMAAFSMEVFDNEVVPSSLSSIAPILRVAAEIESERPRVAYLCKFVALRSRPRLPILGDFRRLFLAQLGAFGVSVGRNGQFVMICLATHKCRTAVVAFIWKVLCSRISKNLRRVRRLLFLCFWAALIVTSLRGMSEISPRMLFFLR